MQNTIKYKKSPIFYMGNKYKLLKYLLPLFPKQINNFYDLFGGSGVVSINVNAKNIYYNEINENVYNLFKMFKENNADDLDKYFCSKTKEFNIISAGKNYRDFPGFDKGYYKFREYYNASRNKDYRDLYLLICYSMNHLIRFNKKNEFNVSVGSIQRYTKEDIEGIQDKIKNINIDNCHYKDIKIINENTFVYCDPPYTNTLAVYNEKRAFGGWNENSDKELFEYLELLNKKGIKWGLSNVFVNRGKINKHLIEWCNKNNWNVNHLNRNYNPFSKGNSNSDEVYICNYETESMQMSIFDREMLINEQG